MVGGWGAGEWWTKEARQWRGDEEVRTEGEKRRGQGGRCVLRKRRGESVKLEIKQRELWVMGSASAAVVKATEGDISSTA